MKRYTVFAGSFYYPAGGWHDFKGSYDTIDEARSSVVKALAVEWVQVVDLTTGEMVVDD
jgi:hypothetical protein